MRPQCNKDKRTTSDQDRDTKTGERKEEGKASRGEGAEQAGGGKRASWRANARRGMRSGGRGGE